MKLIKSHDVVGGSELPWRKSLHPERSKNRSVNFWQHRKYSYISRTATWDEFPNGRWGDSRSPAFGDIDLCASELLRQSPKRLLNYGVSLNHWQELSGIIINYLKGDLKSLPWSDNGPVGMTLK